ncbi:MAG: MFS transporter, partial [Firmicutes bacterium]|nr:MFS transporter [Bacillota bacterium]
MSTNGSKKGNPFRSIGEIVTYRDYSLLWFGQSVSQIGDAITAIAVPLVVYNLTHSILNLTASFVVQAIPWIAFGPFAGVVVDRINRRHVLILSDLLRALAIGLIFLAHTVVVIYLLTFLSQILATVFAPARSSVIPALVPRHVYVRAISLSQASYQIVQFLGPLIASGIIAATGTPRVAVLADCVSFCIATLATVLTKIPPAAARVTKGDEEDKPSFFAAFTEGAAFLWKNKTLRFATNINVLKSLIQSAVLVGCVLYVKLDMALAANVADRVYGLVVSAMGVGMAVGALMIGTSMAGI